MCGIVAYYGKQNQVLETLLGGLKRLEYRGYDSSGVAIITKDSAVFSAKEPGKIINLENEIGSKEIPEFANIGLAHTRWATHGIPNKNNAHPHHSFNKKIWVIHNGIIENYKELKEELKEKGLEFYSDTDTEVIPNLIQYFYTDNLKEAVLKALSKVRGAYSLGIFTTDEPDHLIGAKKGSPLVLGVGDGELILASDVSPVISRTRDVIYLEDNEIVDIRGGEYEILSLENSHLDKKIEHIDWDDNAANKEGFEHFLLKEIVEQPRVIQDSIRGRLVFDAADIKFGGLLDVQDRLKTIEKVVIVGIGTSFYAAKLGEMYFESLAGIFAKAEMSPEFRYKDSAIDDKTWVIAISQSGETADTIAAIEEAKRKGALVTGIVNTVGSTISRITDAGVYNHIGPEISVASTKAFTSSSVILLMHAILLGRMKGLGFAEGEKLINSIKGLPQLISEVVKDRESIKQTASKYKDYKNLIYLGRKYNYPVSLEGALKIKEISYIHAEGLSGGELKHGFIALIDENLPTVALATKDSVYEKMYSNLEEIRARSGPILAIATKNDEAIKDIARDIIYVPESDSEETQAILNNISLQLFAYYCSAMKGLDVDKPRNLAKSVTVE
jgi:glucosamine--fructose-6-phosphate aminotransferase (isomerizing)